MSFKAPENLPLFYAHAPTLEQESVDRYSELADAMETHHNDELTELFRRLSGYGQQHADDVAERAKDYDLPKIAPWEFSWIDDEGPETAAYGEAYYLMTAYHALNYALKNETRGQEYYARVARETGNPDVARAAAEFAEEESEHVHLVNAWRENINAPDPLWDLEFDPANQPE